MNQAKYKKFGVHIKVTNIKKSYKFYKALGFKEVFAYGPKEFIKQFKNIPSAPENYRGVTFEVGTSLLEIGDGHLAVKPETFTEKIKSSKISAMLQVESIDPILKICQGNNIKIAVEPREFPWGTKEVVLKDPDGFVLVFIEKYY